MQRPMLISLSYIALSVSALVCLGCATTPHATPAKCQFETGIPGPEDFVLDAQARGGPRLIVSSQQRRIVDKEGAPRFAGALFSVPLLQVNDKSLRLGEAQRLQMRNRDDLAFHPVGMDLHLQADGSRRLYVINRASPGRSLIEIFEIHDNEALFRQRLEDPLLVSANDLVALDDDELYVSNDLTSPSWRASLDTLLAVPTGNVVHYRSGQWRVVIDKLAFANGITTSAAGDHLYVAEMRGKAVLDFPRDLHKGDLAPLRRSFSIPGNVDNISREDGPWLDVAAHPDLLALAASFDDADKRAPSRAYRLNVRTGALQPLFADDGRQVSAASVAMRFGNQVILGQLLEDGLANCQTQR